MSKMIMSDSNSKNSAVDKESESTELMNTCISEAFAKGDLSPQHFRSSCVLEKMVQWLFHETKLFDRKPSIQVRIDAIMELILCSMVFPFAGIGVSSSSPKKNTTDLSLSELVSSTLSIASEVISPSSTPFRKTDKDDKDDKDEKNVLKRVLLFTWASEVSFSKCGSDHDMDEERCELVSVLVMIRVSPLYPIIFTVSEYFPQILKALTRHLLRVKALSDDITLSVKQNAQELREVLAERQLSDSGITVAYTQQMMKRYAKHFFAWLRANAIPIVRNCRSAEIVSSVNQSVRAWLHAEEYDSPKEIIRVYQQRYRQHLSNLSLPLQPFTPQDLAQATKDIVRETLFLRKYDHPEKQINGEEILSEISQVSEIDFGFGERLNKEELLTYILLAASRTIATGDALFIVEDLYGGEGLLLKPLSQNEKQTELIVRVTSQKIVVTVRESFALLSVEDVDGNAVMKFLCESKTFFDFSEVLSESDHTVSFTGKDSNLEDFIKRRAKIEPFLD